MRKLLFILLIALPFIGRAQVDSMDRGKPYYFPVDSIYLSKYAHYSDTVSVTPPIPGQFDPKLFIQTKCENVQLRQQNEHLQNRAARFWGLLITIAIVAITTKSL